MAYKKVMKCETGKTRLSISKMFVLRLFREPPFQTRNSSLVTRSLSVIIHLNMRSLSKTPSGLAVAGRSVISGCKLAKKRKRNESDYSKMHLNRTFAKRLQSGGVRSKLCTCIKFPRESVSNKKCISSASQPYSKRES